jgi:hypothetical protein
VVFKTTAIDHSAIPPMISLRNPCHRVSPPPPSATAAGEVAGKGSAPRIPECWNDQSSNWKLRLYIPFDESWSELQTLYNETAAAYVRARTIDDLEAIHRSIDTPDCRFIDIGQPPKQWREIRGDLAAGLRAPLQSMSLHIEQLDLDAKANVMIATTTMRSLVRVRAGPFGAVHDVEINATVKDSWTKTSAASWLRRSHEQIVAEEIIYVDGKPLPR